MAFDRTVDHVKSIAFVTPKVPDTPLLLSLGPVTPYPILFGVAGAGGDLSVQQTHSNRFGRVLASQHFSPLPMLESEIIQALVRQGYVVTPVAANRIQTQGDNSGGDVADHRVGFGPDSDFLSSYPPTQADAYLDVVLTEYGYLGTNITSPYRPDVRMKFRLVRVTDGKVLMQGSFGYSIIGADTMPPDQYNYWSITQFEKDPTRAIAGISEGLKEGAQTVGSAMD